MKAKMQKTERSKVYFASVNLKKPEVSSSFPAKLQRILEHFNLKRLCRNDRVPIKMHFGGQMGYTTIHPLFVKLVVEAVKHAGGKPYAVDGLFDSLVQASDRGYTAESLGCPVVAAGGPYDSHVVPVKTGMAGLEEIMVYGAIWDAPCLINFSHVKGHGACAYGGACKNIAMGCVSPVTRSKLHGLEGGIEWQSELCNLCGSCVRVCDKNVISLDKKRRTLSFFFHDCRYCFHCVSACPRKALKVGKPDSFRRFQTGMAAATKAILSSFKPGRVLHINLLTNISMLCDCWGFSSPNIVPDIGVMASHDMVALETASLDAIKSRNFIKGSLIGRRKLGGGKHLLEQIHAKDPFIQIHELEKQGVGQSRYQLIEID